MESFFREFQSEAGRVLIGLEEELGLALCCLVSGGNLLIEDTPGAGKTTLVKVLAKVLGLDFQRVQFTNDLLPADILGSCVFNATTKSFDFHRGPIFSQLVLGDELNRASPRTQSAVLQAMDEHEVTIEGGTHRLPSPFYFVATQNPHEQVGTSPLPESQLDRFMMRLELGAGGRDMQRALLLRDRGRARAGSPDIDSLRRLADGEMLLGWQREVGQLPISDTVTEYLLDLMEEARRRGWRLSPRAGMALQRAAQARAFLDGRPHVRPDDVQAVFPSVVAHRLAQHCTSNRSAREGDAMARELLAAIPVP